MVLCRGVNTSLRYTKNRAFRLYLSRKCGKVTALLPPEGTPRYRPADPITENGEWNLFLDSLISCEHCRRCDIVGPVLAGSTGGDSSGRGGGGGAGGGAGDSGGNSGWGFGGHTATANGGFGGVGGVGGAGGYGSVGGGPSSSLPSSSLLLEMPLVLGPSPCLVLNDFIISRVRRGGVQGGIRCWKLTLGGGGGVEGGGGGGGGGVGGAKGVGEGGGGGGPAVPLKPVKITFEISRNRWCGNVGRPHRSNHIRVVADLQAWVVWQECHDPQCALYQSPRVGIPQEVQGAMRASLLRTDGKWGGVGAGRG